VDEVVVATGFELDGASGEVPTTREPTEQEQRIIAELDPKGLRYKEVPA
jgi:hypothetical protein